VNATGIPVSMVRGTNLFNLKEKAVKEHADLFGDRLYTVETEKNRYVMRYAACHEQFSMMRDWVISYKQLPLGALEIADAYRLEQSGETMLLFRVRRLNMPDFHVLCADRDAAWAGLEQIHDKIMEEARRLDRDYDLLINVSSQRAFEENKPLILKLIQKEKRPGLGRKHPHREDGRDIRPNCHEAGVADRKLPHVPVDQIQADGEHDVDADELQHQLDVGVDDPNLRQHDGEGERRQKNNGQSPAFPKRGLHGASLRRSDFLRDGPSQNACGAEDQEYQKQREGHEVAIG